MIKKFQKKELEVVRIRTNNLSTLEISNGAREIMVFETNPLINRTNNNIN